MSKNNLLRIAQYERYLDENFQQKHAKGIVKGKIQNGMSLLKRYQRNHPDIHFFDELMSLGFFLKKLDDFHPVPVILGIEGKAAVIYFSAFKRMIRSEMVFEKRTRRPPQDPVNALLSLGYMLLTNELFSLLMAKGFDAYIGYLHGISYGKPSLALDIVEEFRHTVVDRFTLYLTNNKILTDDDFERAKNGGVVLKKQALKGYFLEYEKRMKAEFSYPHGGDKVSYRSVMRRQVERLAQSILTNQPYESFKSE